MNSDDEIDEVLRGIPEPPTSSLGPIDDGALLAYRAGRLAPDEEEALERRLAEDAEARALLAELDAPIDVELRDALRDMVARPEFASDQGRRRWPGPAWLGSRRGFAALALSAAAALLIVARPRPSPSKLGYQMELDGFMAERRGAAPSSQVLLPHSTLEVRLRPREPTTANLDCGIYTMAEQRLHPVSGGELSSRGGAFRFRAPAHALFDGPGLHHLVFVVGPRAGQFAQASLQEVEGADHLRWVVDVDYREGVEP